MMIYKNLYDFEVIDKLVNGERVYVLDREFGEVYIVNGMTVNELMQTLANSRKEETRYVFWTVKEAEGAKEDAEL